jgi:hypothetical protein
MGVGGLCLVGPSGVFCLISHVHYCKWWVVVVVDVVQVFFFSFFFFWFVCLLGNL